MGVAHSLGIVVIGRNEGERLRACLDSLRDCDLPVVYVDSGSRDGSAPLALSRGCSVVELDPARPFTAARARNEGFDRLQQVLPHVPYVQFLDGDCELMDGWIQRGLAGLSARKDAVIVCGRVRERRAQATIYGRLCALEWQKSPGEIQACGGIFMIRAEAFRAIGGFRPEVIAAEDDELCLRLRRRGGKVLHLDADMAWHDVAMTRFGQWWRRAKRSGHAYAQGAALHGQSEDRHFVRDCRRIWFWGLALPLASAVLAWPSGGLSLLLLGAYPIQVVRMLRAGLRRGWPLGDAMLYAVFTVIGKFPGLVGLWSYHWRRWRGKEIVIVEHKEAGTPA